MKKRQAEGNLAGREYLEKRAQAKRQQAGVIGLKKVTSGAGEKPRLAKAGLVERADGAPHSNALLMQMSMTGDSGRGDYGVGGTPAW